MAHVEQSELPVISDLNEFDYDSGTFLEKLVFNNRAVVMLICALVTLVLGFQAFQIELKAGFEKTLPKAHQFVINYEANKNDLKGLGNNLRIVVAVEKGTIFSAENLKFLEEVNDAIFFIPGVDRNGMKSLFTPNTRWRVVTEQGFEGGPVIPGNFDGSDGSIAEVKRNIRRAGIMGDLVANNEKSAAIIVPLLDKNPETGERLDYSELGDKLEEIRAQFTEGSSDKSIHIIGFAKLIADLIDGLFAVMVFFAVAVVIATALLYWYTRCFRSTVMVIACTLVAVAWQLGILSMLGYELDPFSILVPFLVFAIGVSHGAQKLNGVLQDIGRGTHRYIAARYTFRRLFLAGVTALLSDGVGFAVLMIIQIQVIQDLAITASIGVLVLIFTNLILIPIVLSYTGVGRKCAERAARPVKSAEEMHIVWRFLLSFTKPGPAAAAIAVSVLLAVVGLYVAMDLKIGDLDKGAPELRADSTYNKDVAFMTENYSVSTDVFAIIIKTAPDGCIDLEGLNLANELEWQLRQVPGVEDVRGLNVRTREIMMGINEGFPKWQSLFRNQDTVNYAVSELVTLEYVDPGCSIWPMLIYLADHKAETLEQVVTALDTFNEEWGEVEKIEFMGAAGSSGFEAATNIVVKKANREMLFYVYGAVIVLCMLTFRSVPGVICAVLPLMLTSILCEALMVWLGMGVKVATLPVIALGVGIGVDYALYVLTVILAKEKQGMDLTTAYYETLNFTGRVVALIGITLAAGVITWAASPIKFQADMGILLTFMFIWNMFGALILMPALACFLVKPNKEVAEA
ncbi:RND family transporter [Halieaceae bacterium IMCC8485]|jgi:predicted RND superfamily exporter protein|uniref:RND family transporter n=1 Tax=Candidatus Seongchinamella marina TaxID=2518990 RepID=A0ABT3SSB3_9GAMM|nr:MMPL family transporter [Candidatus Seongchinamella marina]MCX2972883.1 RND family transporter [Candidatus Seongchinamella marina]